MTNTRTLLLVALAVIVALVAYNVYESNQSGVEIRAPGVNIDTK